MTLPREQLDDFLAVPWAAALLSDASLERIQTSSRIVPQPDSQASHTLFSATLASPDTVRAVQSFAVRDAGRESNDKAKDGNGDKSNATPARQGELLMLYSLGTGLNGPFGILHGGIPMMILDSAMAYCAHLAANGARVLTAQNNVAFKRPLRTPCIVLARAWIERVEDGGRADGRKKLFTKALLEGYEPGKDGRTTGTSPIIYAEASGLLISQGRKSTPEMNAKL